MPNQSGMQSNYIYRDLITYRLYRNAVIDQTTSSDKVLKPDRLFGWNEIIPVQRGFQWVPRIQIPFAVIESKPLSKADVIGDT